VAGEALAQLLDGPILVEDVRPGLGKRLFLRGQLRLRVSRIVSALPDALTTCPAASESGEDVVSLTIDFRRSSRSELQAQEAWRLLQQQVPLAEIRAQLVISKSRLTAVLKTIPMLFPGINGEAVRQAVRRVRPHQPSQIEQLEEAVMPLFERGLLIREIATRLGKRCDIVKAVIAHWHCQRGLPVPDCRTRMRSPPRWEESDFRVQLDDDVSPDEPCAA
jgi:hypothetical protein